MKTLRRFLYKEILTAVAFVTVAFLALFFFFDFVDELRWVGRSATGAYTVSAALMIRLSPRRRRMALIAPSGPQCS